MASRHTRVKIRPFVANDFRELEPTSGVRRALQAASWNLMSQYFRIDLSRLSLAKGIREIKKHPEAAAELGAELKRLRADWDAVLSYLATDIASFETNSDRFVEKCLRAGLKASEALQAARTVNKKKRGAPITARVNAVKALDLRLEDPHQWTWKRLGAEFCVLSSPVHRHSMGCQERIRHAVLGLERLVRRHGVHPSDEH